MLNTHAFKMCVASASLGSAEQLEELASVADRKIAKHRDWSALITVTDPNL